MEIEEPVLKRIQCILEKNPGCESEIRFGVFHIDNYFKPGVSMVSFTESIKFLNTFAKFDRIEFLNIFYYPGSLKRYELTDTFFGDSKKTFYIKKSLIENIDIGDYNVRLAFNKETNLDTAPAYFVHDNYSLMVSRKRFTYLYKNLKFDISMFYKGDQKSGFDKSRVYFDLEIEFLGGDIRELFDMSFNFTKIIQQTDTPLKESERDTVIECYKRLTTKNMFVGAQPKTLTEESFDSGNDYALTLKLKGTRHLLINTNGKIYSITKGERLEVKKVLDFHKSVKTFLLDTEFFKGRYHVFDILFYDGVDIRKELFSERLSFVKKVVETESVGNIVKKEYMFCNKSENPLSLYKTFNDTYKKYFSTQNENLDGIILVPVNKSYNDGIPLKWKPENENTIDFRIDKIDESKWNLLVGVEGNREQVFASTTVDAVTFEKYSTGSVVEFRYSKTQEKFIPVMVRNDKFKPNFISVATDNFNSITKPFDFEYFKPNTKKKPEFFNGRRFNNYVKSVLIKRYSKNAYTLLDLACGKGGDIYKWIDSNITTVKGYDICRPSVNEAVSRYNVSIKNESMTKNYNFSFSVADIADETICTDEDNDLVTCFFAIHYFFKTERSLMYLVNNVVSNIKRNGYFLMSTFSDVGLKDINYTVDTSTFRVTPGKFSGTPFGNEISVWIKDSVLDEPRVEYVVPFNFLVSVLKGVGLVLVEQGHFVDFYNDWKNKRNLLSEKEKNFCFLNRYAVFTCVNKNVSIDLNKFDVEMEEPENAQEPEKVQVEQTEQAVKTMNFKDLESESEEQSESEESDEDDLFTETELKSMKIKELKELCKARNLKLTGKKEELVVRLTGQKK